jgi:hypothetical protein
MIARSESETTRPVGRYIVDTVMTLQAAAPRRLGVPSRLNKRSQIAGSGPIWPIGQDGMNGRFLTPSFRSCHSGFGQILPFAWDGRRASRGQNSAVARGGNLVELPLSHDERQNSHPRGPGGARQ